LIPVSFSKKRSLKPGERAKKGNFRGGRSSTSEKFLGIKRIKEESAEVVWRKNRAGAISTIAREKRGKRLGSRYQEKREPIARSRKDRKNMKSWKNGGKEIEAAETKTKQGERTPSTFMSRKNSGAGGRRVACSSENRRRPGELTRAILLSPKGKKSSPG